MPAIIVAALFGLVSLIWNLVNQVVAILIRPVLQHLNALDPDVPLSPADAADAVERNIMDQGEGEGYAASSGYAPEVFDLMVKLTGEPPGLEQMLSLWRRGLLDQGTLETMIAYSRVRTEWTGYVMDLAHDTMSAGDAVEAVLKGVIDEGTGADLFSAAGGLPDQFATMLATAGNPIGVEAANQLYNHGLITDAQLTSVILHSRVNPEFEGMAKLLRFHYISAYQISEMLKAGAATAEQATSWLLAQGYPADQVASFVKSGSAVKAAVHKTLSESQITEAYDAGLLTAAQATSELTGLGYDAGEVPFILALYDYRRKLSMDQAAIGQIRKMVLAGRIDKTTASNQLDSLGVDSFARDNYLAIWAIEAGSELKELTAAQIGGLYKKGGLDDATALAKWQAMGYSADDAGLLLFNYGGAAPAGSPAATAAAATSAS